MSGRVGSKRRGSSGASRPLQFAPFFCLLLFLAVNVALIEHLDTRLKPKPSHQVGIVTPGDVLDGREQSSDQKLTSSNDTVLEHFRHAGVELDEESLKKLPTWETIIQQIGPKPVYLGEETCQRFQDTVPALGRMIGSAGMFNSGTNLVTKLLKMNCVIPEQYEKYKDDPKATKEQFGIMWQCPWGKHTPVRFKYNHTVPIGGNDKKNKEYCLPVVTIRNPYDWMKSMCKHPYTAKWVQYEGGLGKVCPHLVHSPKSLPNKKVSVKLTAKFSEFELNVDSLAHLYNIWYADYWQHFNMPYLFVRFEDLIFRPYEVTEAICSCAGGRTNPRDKFEYVVESAKSDSPGHGDELTGMLDAWIKYGNPMEVKAGFNDADWEASLEFLSRDLMKLLHFKYPPSA